MKKMKNLYVYVILGLGLVFSCSKMEDNFKDYLGREDKVYAGKVDSVSLRTGYNRIQFDISTSVRNIETVRVFWNDFADSLDVSISSEPGITTKILDGIAEKDYNFNFVSIDTHGNKSLPFSVPGKIYGEKYIAVRSIRPIKEIQLMDTENLIVVWNGIVDDGVYCDLTYTDINDQEVSLRVPMSDTETEINDINAKLGFSYTTVYLPEEDAIDEFFSESVLVQPEIAFELSKETWSLVSLPTDVKGDCWGGSISGLWNGKTNDYYHSGCYGTVEDLIPHHFTFDLGVDANLVKVRLDPRTGCCQGRNPKRFQIWGISDLTDAETTLDSNDPNWEQEMIDKGWVQLLDHETAPSWNGSAEGYITNLTDNTSVRYIRYRILDNWNGEPYSALSELTFWYGE